MSATRFSFISLSVFILYIWPITKVALKHLEVGGVYAELVGVQSLQRSQGDS